jgi:hypothetical protein
MFLIQLIIQDYKELIKIIQWDSSSKRLLIDNKNESKAFKSSVLIQIIKLKIIKNI